MNVRAAGGSVALAAPDERHGQPDGGVQASHLDGGSRQGGERPREDRGGETSGGERAQEEGVAALEGEAEWLAGVREPLLQCGGDGRAAARRDDLVLGQVGHVDAWSGWGAVGGEGGDHLVMAESLDGEFVGDLAGQQAEGGVEFVGGDQAQHVGGDALAEADLDARVCLAEACEQARDVDIAGGHERSDPDSSAQDPAKLVDLRACAVHLGQDTAGSSGDRLACLGWGDAAARAFEKLDPQLFFEPPDLVRQRRLGDMELLGGAREVAVARHRLDASQLP